MTATTGIWNREMAGSHSVGVTAMDSSTDNSSSSSTNDAASISSNDFLTLLVTEMQNQDPTANTDPNEYINQLVQVNSLEQLISINQTLSSRLEPAPGDQQPRPVSSPAAVPIGASQVSSPAGAAGNLAIPPVSS